MASLTKCLGYTISLTLEQFMSVTYALYSPVAGFRHGGGGGGEGRGRGGERGGGEGRGKRLDIKIISSLASQTCN